MKMIAGFILLLAPAASFAASGARSLAIPMSVRQMGMGDVSAAGAGILGAWSNPALLASQASQGEVAIGGGSLFGAEAQTFGLGGGWKLGPNLTLGALVSSYGVSFDQLDGSGLSLSKALSQRTTAGGATVAWRRGLLTAGGTLKGLSDSVMNSNVTTASVDLGVTAVYEQFTAGGALRNAGGKLRDLNVAGASGIPVDGLPMETRIGASYKHDGLAIGGGVEYMAVTDAPGVLGAGVEWWPADMLALRLGMTGLSGEAQRQLTLGVSAKYAGATLDYAMGAHPLGPVHRVSLSYAFGEAPEEGESSRAAAPAAKLTPVKGGRRRVVVARLYASQLAQEEADAIVELLRNELANHPQLATLTWAATEEEVGDKSLLAKGCAVEDCAVKIGKKAKADVVVVGSVGKLMGRFFISARAVDVASGAVKVIDQAKGDTVDQLEKGIKALAGRLAKKLR